MATYTPPPYFPQSSLAPPDKNRYRNFKLAMVGLGLVVLVLMTGFALSIWYLLKWAF